MVKTQKAEIQELTCLIAGLWQAAEPDYKDAGLNKICYVCLSLERGPVKLRFKFHFDLMCVFCSSKGILGIGEKFLIL
jgi:hypothetical protein